MFKILFAVVLCINIASIYSEANDDGVNWALLIAGSNEYYNYRHQADICHAYQIMHRNGIPDERIVVMMYDDIANSDDNPKKGIIINHPNGKDVYKGTLKDYTKETVTPDNFLKVLQGEAISVGSKKTIKSGPNDNVFVYFADHGAPGLIAFPDGSVLHASELNKAIKSMHDQKKYKNLVFYIEACESGSMFNKLLPNNINVYATTAANPTESSYACYYDDTLQTYLGDLYSVNWMEDTDAEDISKETLFKQFQIVKKKTDQSHVIQYGNLTMGTAFKVSDFQSEKKSYKFDPSVNTPVAINDAVKSEDVRLSILNKKLAKETSPIKKQLIQREIQQVLKLKQLASAIIQQIATDSIKGENVALENILESKLQLSNHECYVSVVNRLLEKCFSAKNEYVLRNLQTLVNLCETQVSSAKIISAIDNSCPVRLSD